MCTLTAWVCGPQTQRLWDETNQALLDNVAEAVRRDPGRRVLVTVNCRRSRRLEQGLRRIPEVTLVDFHDLRILCTLVERALKKTDGVVATKALRRPSTGQRTSSAPLHCEAGRGWKHGVGGRDAFQSVRGKDVTMAAFDTHP